MYLFENQAAGNIGDSESILGVCNSGIVIHNIYIVKIGGCECMVLISKDVLKIRNLELNYNIIKLYR